MSRVSGHPIMLKANQVKSSRNSRGWSVDLLPGVIVLAGIACMSFLWAGVKPVGFTLGHICAFSALAVSLNIGHLNIRSLLKSRIVHLMLLLQLVILINLIAKDSPALGWDMWFVGWDCLFVIMVISYIPRNRLRQLFTLFCLLGTILAIMHIILILTGGMSSPRLGFLKHGYHYGVFSLLVLFPATGAYFSSHRTFLRYLGITTSVSNLLFLMIDSKTGSLVLALVGITLFCVRASRFSSKNVRIFLVIVLAVAGFAALNLSDWFIRDVYTSLQLENPIIYHWYPMRTAIAAGMDNPLLGIGAGRYPYLSGMYRRSGVLKHFYRAHNSYLEFFAETGFTGVIALLIILIFIGNKAFQLSKKRQISRWIHRGFKVSIGTVAIAALWDFGPQLPANLFTVCFCGGFLLADRSKEKYKDSSPGPFVWLVPALLAIAFMPALGAGILQVIGERAEKNNQFHSAAELYTRAVSLSPYDDRFTADAANALTQVAILEQSKESINRALKYLDRSLAGNHHQATVHYSRSYLLSTFNRLEQPSWTESLSTAYSLDPTDHRIAVPYSYILAEQGDYASAETILVRAMEQLDYEEYSAFAEGFCNVWTDPDRLREFLLNSQKNFPGELTVTLLESIQKEGLDIIVKEVSNEILTDLIDNESITLSPAARVIWVRVLIRSKMISDAFTVINFYENTDPENHSTAVLCSLGGSHYRRQREFQKALVWYDKAKSMGLDDLSFELNYIGTKRQLSRSFPALTELLRLNSRYPNSPIVHYELAREYERKGENLKALDEYRKANQLSGNEYLSEQRQAEDHLEIPELWRTD